MLGEQDVGHRVVVRRIVGVRDDRPLYSDALGELTELTETHLTVQTARGPLRVPLAEVHRAKRVPPRRRSARADVIALELAANDAWPAPIQDRLGDWLLRAADGWTGRANSALPIGYPGRTLAEAVDAVRRWYTERGLPPAMNVPLPLATAVNDELDARGWAALPPVLVQAAPLAAVLAGSAGDGGHDIRLEAEPSADWLRIAGARKHGLPAAAHHLLTAVRHVRFAHAYAAGGELIGIARGTVTGDGWFGTILVEVVPEARRRGLARHMITKLAGWAAGAGANRAFLQVEERNAGAVALYAGLGFTTHHTYVTRRLVPPTGG